MKQAPLQIHQLENGLEAVVEPLASARSVSMHLLFDFGAKDDPPRKAGLAALAVNSAMRGCRGKSLRTILNALDDYGVDREATASVESVSYSANFLPEHLKPVLRLFGRILSSSTFPNNQVAVVKALAEESLLDQEDIPDRQVIRHAQRGTLGLKLGCEPLGKIDTVRQIPVGEVRTFWKQFCSASNLKIVLAGALNEDDALEAIKSTFSDWPAGGSRSSRPQFKPKPYSRHLPTAFEQTHLCLSLPTAPVGHPLYYPGFLASVVLSGGSSSRLFTEVREKRGLAYTVNAFHRIWRSGALLNVYAGTNPERLDETLKVCKEELHRLHTISKAELNRARTAVRGRLLTAGELPENRAAALSGQMLLTGQPRSLAEVIQAVDSVKLDEVREFLKMFPPSPITIVTLGEKPPG